MTTTQLTFTTNVQPILNASCMPCHSATMHDSNYDLSSYSDTLKDVAAGSPSGSKLVQKISAGGSMATYLSASDAITITNWVQAGSAQ